MSEIEKLKSLKWDDPSKFKIYLDGDGVNNSGLKGIDPEIWTMVCNDITLPEFNVETSESYIAEDWVINSGRISSFDLTLNFKDISGYSLYNTWYKALKKFVRKYPDDQRINVSVYVQKDVFSETLSKLITFKECILSSVTSTTLDNSAYSSVAEFSVSLKCPYVE